MSAAPSEPPTQPTLAAALAAWDAGLCVVRVNADGTKTPIGRLAQWRLDHDTALRDKVLNRSGIARPADPAIDGQMDLFGGAA